MAMGKQNDVCIIHKVKRVNGVCKRCSSEECVPILDPMGALDRKKDTESCRAAKDKIEIARSKLPNPPGMKFGQTIDIDVTSIETGVSSPGDECIGIDTFKFVLTRNGWELFEPGKDNVAKLVESKPDESTCGENVVQRLEEALALAKEGKIDNVMIIAIGNDGCNYDAWANGKRTFEMMGALESTKLDFFNTMTNRRG